MKRLLLLVLPASAGCAAFNDAQLNLTTQARHGIALVAKSDERRDTAITELARLRRQRLDDAFDADVRERETLDPEWIIDARKAYASALDAYAKAQATDEANAAQRRRNLESIDAALQRLQWLQSVQSKFNLLETEK